MTNVVDESLLKTTEDLRIHLVKPADHFAIFIDLINKSFKNVISQWFPEMVKDPILVKWEVRYAFAPYFEFPCRY